MIEPAALHRGQQLHRLTVCIASPAALYLGGPFISDANTSQVAITGSLFVNS